MGSEKKILLIFFIFTVSPWELLTPWGVANLDPRGMVGRIYVGDKQKMLHTKSVSSEPHGFREEEFWRFFSYTVLYKHKTPLGCG